MSDFIKRDELSSELKGFRDDLKTDIRDFRTDIKDDIQNGFEGVNKRLDIVNGRLNKHDRDLGAQDAINQQHSEALTKHSETLSQLTSLTGVGFQPSKKMKAGLATGASVGILAVLHSAFEMITKLVPAVMDLFSKHIK
jgi:hypothetical protein